LKFRARGKADKGSHSPFASRSRAVPKEVSRGRIRRARKQNPTFQRPAWARLPRAFSRLVSFGQGSPHDALGPAWASPAQDSGVPAFLARVAVLIGGAERGGMRRKCLAAGRPRAAEYLTSVGRCRHPGRANASAVASESPDGDVHAASRAPPSKYRRQNRIRFGATWNRIACANTI
jgi:hypothetical protein